MPMKARMMIGMNTPRIAQPLLLLDLYGPAQYPSELLTQSQHQTGKTLVAIRHQSMEPLPTLSVGSLLGNFGNPRTDSEI